MNPTPLHEAQTHASEDELDFTDPPGTDGTGNPSGGRNAAVGFELFDSGYDSKQGGYVENASTATCTFGPARKELCNAVLRNVRVEFQTTLQKTR